MSPNGQTVPEEAPREFLIDHANFRRAAAVRHAEVPAQKDRKVHGLEVIGRNELHVRIGSLRSLVLESLHGHAAVPFIAREDRHYGQAG